MFDIDREHPEYVARKRTWKKYRDLYVGGEQLQINAQDYLIRRQREPGDVYAERLSRVFYENYIGSIVDWYSSTLFRREPVLAFEGNNDSGKAFFSALVEDADRRGTHFNDFFRRVFTESMITGGGYVLVDFPKVAGESLARAEKKMLSAPPAPTWSTTRPTTSSTGALTIAATSNGS